MDGAHAMQRPPTHRTICEPSIAALHQLLVVKKRPGDDFMA